MFARTVSFPLKPVALKSAPGSSTRTSFLCSENRMASRTKSRSLPPTELKRSASACGTVEENAETYARGAYPGVLKALEHVVEGTRWGGHGRPVSSAGSPAATV
jgi:hypothetical protein